MFKFNNTHIFTGYLKQKLASTNIPTCKIYTQEFAKYYAEHGKEDPRIIESINTIDYRTSYADNNIRLATRVNYLKNNEIYNYLWNYEKDVTKETDLHKDLAWHCCSNIYYDIEKNIPGLTKTLYSPGRFYDQVTHEYLGEYLRFLRDYYNINLMSLYNCFNNTICNNLYYRCNLTINNSFNRNEPETANNAIYNNSNTYHVFDSKDTKYKIYAIPVKLFANYTIAIDSHQGIEMFCGLYNTNIDTTNKSTYLFAKTYKKFNSTIFSQPILYDKLDVKFWKYEDELRNVDGKMQINNTTTISRWDIANREQDLKLFIKVPASSKSSIVILEGDYRTFNDVKYMPSSGTEMKWLYKQNYTVVNFELDTAQKRQRLNDTDFVPISKLQLLAFNTEESYPFADRLIEYLSGSAITPIDEITDNIKRAQRVMSHNNHYFAIEGLWENKMQKIIYDYIINSGPVKFDANTKKFIDERQGLNRRLGHNSKSTVYDILGYVDKDAEKWYVSWKAKSQHTDAYKSQADVHESYADVRESIQNVDIYVDQNGHSLYEDF